MHTPFHVGGMRETWKWILADFREARVTRWVIGLILLIYLGVWLSGPDGAESVYYHAGLTRDGLLAGKVWQLLSHGFLHANGLHLFFNVATLLMTGMQLERLAGHRGLLQVFLAGILCGGLAHVTIQPATQANLTLVGSSGGIAAIFFFLITLSPESRSRFIPLSWRTLGRLLFALQTGLVAMTWLPQELPFIPPAAVDALRIGHACHLGGSLAGWWLARRFMSPRLSRHETEKLLQKRQARLLSKGR